MNAFPQPKHVLVIEDNYDAADSFVQLLEACGHHAQAAYSAHEALSVLRAYRADLIFLDIGLPDINGYELARQIRRNQPNVTLVALTGYAPDSNRARAAGFNQQITKPIMLDRLRSLLESQMT